MQGLWFIALDVPLPTSMWVMSITCLTLAAFCVRAAYRREINTRCASALSFVFLAPVVQVFRLDIYRRSFPDVSKGLDAALTWASLGCMGVAFLLSLLGLAQIAAQRERRVGGKWLGSFALIVSASTLAVFWATRGAEVSEAQGQTHSAARMESKKLLN